MLNGMPLPESKLCGLNGVERWRRAMIGVKRKPKPVSKYTSYSPPDVDSLDLINKFTLEDYLLERDIECCKTIGEVNAYHRRINKAINEALNELLKNELIKRTVKKRID